MLETSYQDNALSPLSPKHVQSTTKRALKAAQPLRDEVQAKVSKYDRSTDGCLEHDDVTRR